MKLLDSKFWSLDDTEAWLTANPLPPDFRWGRTIVDKERIEGRLRITGKRVVPNQVVLPEYRLHKGYGFWLRKTPNFEGLFEACRRAIVGLGAKLPEDGAALAARLVEPPAPPAQEPLFQTFQGPSDNTPVTIQQPYLKNAWDEPRGANHH